MVIVPESLRQNIEQPIEEQPKQQKPPKPVKQTLSEKEAVAKVTELARNGEQLEAMKLYRETFPVGLKETKAAIDQVEMGLPLPIPAIRAEDEMDLPLAAAEKITQLVTAGKSAEAAKLYRITFDTSRVEADAAVQQLLAGKSINIARRKAKDEAQATAVRREPEDDGNSDSSNLMIVGLFAFIILVVVVLVGLVLIFAF